MATKKKPTVATLEKQVAALKREFASGFRKLSERIDEVDAKVIASPAAPADVPSAAPETEG